ncbi:MAG: hypothetical protein H0T99_05015 [Geodermatophilaceae bacterium]|nr:hypothetical protein [Geodermatophilaceae bacterium]
MTEPIRRQSRPSQLVVAIVLGYLMAVLVGLLAVVSWALAESFGTTSNGMGVIVMLAVVTFMMLTGATLAAVSSYYHLLALAGGAAGLLLIGIQISLGFTPLAAVLLGAAVAGFAIVALLLTSSVEQWSQLAGPPPSGMANSA